MRKTLLFIFLLLSATLVKAGVLEGLMDFVRDMHGNPVIIEQDDQHTRIKMADSCYYDVYTPLSADTIVLIQTVCAPICSSCVHVYSKEWELIHSIEPACGGIFPEAEYHDGHVVWHDNTPLYLDEEEKKRIQ